VIRSALKIAVVTLALAAAVITAGLAIAVLAFPYPAEQLAPERGGPLVITDRRGEVLRQVPAADGRPGRAAWVPLAEIRSHAVLTVIASEDQRFFEHKGVDPWGIARAAWLNLKEGRVGYGGSTITMQLVRMIHSPGQERNLTNKIREAVLALRLERALTKRQILEQYLNRAYYGDGAYGIEAAAQTYFGKPAASLSTAEATLLAIVPRGPGVYNLGRNLDRALARRDHVLGLLVEQGSLDADEVALVRAENVEPRVRHPEFRAPHFTDWVLDTLPPEIRARGGVVRTTLDLDLHERLERRLAEHVRGLERRKLGQAGLVVLDTPSGEVLAMVGSPGFFDEDGQLNITVRRRHPGSALKPFVYALALEAGESPASIAHDIADVPSRYKVVKTTQPERGPVRYREALAGSYNLAAVHVLERVGEERLVTRLRQAGVGEVPGDPDEYHLRLALGATKVRLVDLAAGYGFMARGGKVTRPQPVIAVSDPDGREWRPEPADERQVFSPQVSWLTADMLADPQARRPMFGNELPVDDMGFAIAVKTGTSRGFADTVAVGVTEQLTVAAWAGNFDGSPTHGLLAMDAAAPLVRTGMMIGARGRKLTLPARPDGIVTARVCPLSGKLVGDDCPHAKQEQFAAGTVPNERCDWHELEGDRLAVHYPPEVSSWAQRQRHAGGRGI
jgi:penicillin-binding protein 1C